MLLLKHRLKRVHRWHIERDAPLLSSLRPEAQLRFVTDVQHSSIPIDIRELEKEHLFAPQTGIRIQHDEFRPVIEIERVRATRSTAVETSSAAPPCSNGKCRIRDGQDPLSASYESNCRFNAPCFRQRFRDTTSDGIMRPRRMQLGLQVVHL